MMKMMNNGMKTKRTFTRKIAPGTSGLDKKNPLFEMKLSDTSVLAKGGKPFISKLVQSE